jgi:alkanesulfonate monooxygenase SsuD/methylene tetrahydromethanopterin reductase-like flavin-dependent oxidoreductase (luciferase family)
MAVHRLQFGVVLANRGVVLGTTSVQALLALACQAEETGWDSVWVGDSLLAKPRLDAMVLLGALAVQTHRVKLGPASFTSTPLRHALQLALQWCSLDVLSQGRMIFNASQGLQARQGEHLLRNMPLFRSNRLRVCAVWRRRLRSCAWPRLGSA